ncbi:hypothetical protein D7W79_43015, partial [Corallococcus exercitus]|uniref:hypothetical protein n=1 Tax=Corallococcus exercitus TaxID=2316736 RepID=UPI000EE7B6BC
PGVRAIAQGHLPATEEEAEVEPTDAAEAGPWPKRLSEQIAAVRDHVATSGRAVSVASVAALFKRAKRKDVEDILDSLAALGVLTVLDTEAGKRWKTTVRAA